ncbi:MAG TPA: M6 family metalloprotease domain-containing protein, partial [Candidatus Hydrogenedentes bacterium]|nr:M6 family metalloprotease domain-containing protein [Candidatus Hydrogenedentota bacterium]
MRIFPFLILGFCVIARCLWAVPAAPIDVTLSQPDGSSFRATPRGDEYGHWMETADGYAVVRELGIWHYAFRGSRGELLASPYEVGAPSPRALEQFPKHSPPVVDASLFEMRVPRPLYVNGAPRSFEMTQPLLTILVSFTDVGFTYAGDAFQNSVYGTGASVKEYYLENSYDKFSIAPAMESYGTPNDGIVAVTLGFAHPNTGANSIVSGAIAGADPYIDYSIYDGDGNAWVSPRELSILLIIAGYEESYGGEAALTPNIWGQQGAIDSVVHDGVSLWTYAMIGERHATSPLDEHQATIGIICHELGHLMFGLPDLYDRDSSSSGIGNWGVMASGSWGSTGTYIGDSPTHFCAWSKAATNMVAPDDVRTPTTAAAILSSSSNPSIKRLWIDRYEIGEHFLVANRQQSGYDAALPGNGLLIWHIDPLIASQNDDETHKLVDLESADGLAQLDSNDNDGDPGDPYPGTSNNTLFDDSSNPNSKDY